MKLLFLTDNFPPEVNAPATRTLEHCREWARRGVEVTVITCAPNFPSGKIHAGYRNKLWQEEEMDGIRVIRVWSYITANSGFLKRIMDYISFGITAFLASLFVKTDLIVATSPQFFTAVAGWAASACKRRPWVMEVRDLWPESIAAVGAATGNERWFRFLERTERFLYHRANRVVVVTRAFKKNLVERGVPAAKVDVITNGVITQQYLGRVRDQKLHRELGLEGKKVVGYMGTHGMAHKLDFIIDCAEQAPADVHFLFIGGGAHKQALVEQVEKLALTNVTLLPPVPKREIGRYLSLTDIALVPLRRSDTFKSVIPSKIFENAAMNKPILLGVQGESQDIVERYGAGLCFVPEDRADFLRQLRRLTTDRACYAEKSHNCAALARDFDRLSLASRMLTVLESLVAKEKRTTVPPREPVVPPRPLPTKVRI